MDCPYQIPPSGMPAHHDRLQSHTRHCTRWTSHCCHRDRYRHSRSRSQSHPTEITVMVTIGVLHDGLIPVLIIPAVTPPTTDHLHTGAHQLTLRTGAEHIPIQHTNQVRKPCINLQCIPAELKTSCMIKEIQESQ